MQTFAQKKRTVFRTKWIQPKHKDNKFAHRNTNKFVLNLIQLQIILPLAKVQLHFTIKAKCFVKIELIKT